MPSRTTLRSPERFRRRYGPWAVVTGASSGIGRACATSLAATGLGVVLVARGREALDELAGELAARHGVDVRVVVADLASPAGVGEVEAATADLDVGLLVAAAGFGTSGPLLDAELGTELEMLDVNCRAVLALSHHLGRRLAARGRGGIVLLASLVGRQGTPLAAHYAATKAYVLTLAEGLHAELAGRGVDVVASTPGPVRTGFAGRAGMTMSRAAGADEVATATLGALGRRSTVTPGRLATAQSWSLGVLPRSLRVRVMGGVMRELTAPAGSAGPPGTALVERGHRAGPVTRDRQATDRSGGG